MDIIKKIGPLIPKEKLVFWENLRRRDNVADLAVNLRD